MNIIPFPDRRRPPRHEPEVEQAAAKRTRAAAREAAKWHARWLLVNGAAALSECQRRYLLAIYVARLPPTARDLDVLRQCQRKMDAASVRQGICPQTFVP